MNDARRWHRPAGRTKVEAMTNRPNAWTALP
jgi:hypothetical protein